MTALRLLTPCLLALVAVACSQEGGTQPPAAAPERPVVEWSPPSAAARAADLAPREPCAHHDPLRQVFFGDLHTHTAFSLDALGRGGFQTPDDAYRFARGEEIGLSPVDAEGRPTRTARLERPLDFAAVTDHSEWLGEVAVCTDPSSPRLRHPRLPRPPAGRCRRRPRGVAGGQAGGPGPGRLRRGRRPLPRRPPHRLGGHPRGGRAALRPLERLRVHVVPRVGVHPRAGPLQGAPQRHPAQRDRARAAHLVDRRRPPARPLDPAQGALQRHRHRLRGPHHPPQPQHLERPDVHPRLGRPAPRRAAGAGRAAHRDGAAGGDDAGQGRVRVPARHVERGGRRGTSCATSRRCATSTAGAPPTARTAPARAGCAARAASRGSTSCATPSSRASRRRSGSASIPSSSG